MKVAVLKGGDVAGADGLAALRRARRGRAGAARARGAADRRRRGPRRPPDRRAPRRRVRRAARPRRRGRDRPGAARARRHPVHRLAPGRLHPLHGQGRRQARAARRRHPDARLLRVHPDRVRGARRGARAAGDRGAARVPDRRQARRPGLRARDQVRPHRRGRARTRWSPPSPTTRRSCWSATSTGRDLAVSVLDAARRARRRCRWSRRSRTPRTSTTSRRATRSARTRFVCPADLPPELTARAQELALATWKTLGCAGFARVDLMIAATS